MERIRARINHGWLELGAHFHSNACGVGMRIPVGQELHSDTAYNLPYGDFLVDLIGEEDGEIALDDGGLEISTEQGIARFTKSVGDFPSEVTRYADDEQSTLMLGRHEDIEQLFTLPAGDHYSIVAEGGAVSVASRLEGNVEGMHTFEADHTPSCETAVFSQAAIHDAVEAIPETDGYRLYVCDSRPLAIGWVDGSVFGQHLIAPLIAGGEE
ncbi:hypothetical protein [Halocatena halophila]|uniref:hypothetical protein n=1 Tax=Halocatena halophila TaxID=2814576 RepID=UPI002ED2A4E9